MGTYYSVKYIKDFPSAKQSQIKEDFEKILKNLNRQMSTYIKDSEISQFNQLEKNKDFKISSDFAKVLEFSLSLSKKTNGIFDPTVGPLVNLWGFGPSANKRVPSKSEIDKALQKVGFKKIKLKKVGKDFFISKTQDGLGLDLSATAKGFAVDKLSDYLKAQQLANHLVDIGGELKASGNKNGEAWLVAIETPNPSGGGIQKTIALKNKAIATSGSYRNFFTEKGVRYNHTINPKTGASVQSDLVSSSVISSSCMESDGYATALMALGYEKAQDLSLKEALQSFIIKYDKAKNSFETHDQL